jgi:hypothetical protein
VRKNTNKLLENKIFNGKSMVYYGRNVLAISSFQ